MIARVLLTLLCLHLLVPLALAEAWKLDVVRLKNGSQFEGVILEEKPESLVFKHVVRRPGTRTVAISLEFGTDEISRIERIPAEQRKELIARLATLDQSGERELLRMRALELNDIAWPSGERGRQYQGKYFTLTSNAHEDIVRLVIVRLEEVFQAYVDKLASRRQPEKPFQIILLKSSTEYHAQLKAAGLNILNPAYYDPQRNLIVAASDFETRQQELERLRQKHAAQLQELSAHEKKLNRHFNNRPPEAMISQLRQLRRSLQLIICENENTLDRLNRPFFTMLYHEAFHAYVENFMYPSRETPVPVWLNEGWAQIFETALVDTGELRVGHVDRKRLRAVQDAIKKKELVPLVELIRSQPKDFQVAHMSEALASDRYFQAAWALAYYLTFDRKLLGSEDLDRYMLNLKRGTDPVEAFSLLVGQPLAEFEEQFQQYLATLKPDGSVKAASKP